MAAGCWPRWTRQASNAGWRNYPRFCRILRDIVDWCGVEAVLFGTDAPFIEAVVPTQDFIRMIRELPCKAPAGLPFTEAEVEAILSGNASKVLGLEL
ncbi:MAG: amidohydrolase family protein [Chloroflexi bacterium]|nr:amidohydrolase family protein [Chloroflexota bacterium]